MLIYWIFCWICCIFELSIFAVMRSVCKAASRADGAEPDADCCWRICVRVNPAAYAHPSATRRAQIRTALRAQRNRLRRSASTVAVYPVNVNSTRRDDKADIADCESRCCSRDLFIYLAVFDWYSICNFADKLRFWADIWTVRPVIRLTCRHQLTVGPSTRRTSSSYLICNLFVYKFILLNFNERKLIFDLDLQIAVCCFGFTVWPSCRTDFHPVPLSASCTNRP